MAREKIRNNAVAVTSSARVKTMWWAEGKTFVFRTAIFVGLASVVTTIIYFTPIPGMTDI